jgi:hypothetical protein
MKSLKMNHFKGFSYKYHIHKQQEKRYIDFAFKSKKKIKWTKAKTSLFMCIINMNNARSWFYRKNCLLICKIKIQHRKEVVERNIYNKTVIFLKFE